MAVSRLVIDAYKSAYNITELRAMLKVALADRASGVMTTQVNFQDGGGSGQMITGDPNEVIEILQTCIAELVAGEASSPPPLSSTISFRYRRSET